MTKNREHDWLSDRLSFLKKQKKDLAGVLGIHPQHVNRLLLKIKLTPTQFKQLALFLECDYLALLQFWEEQLTPAELFNPDMHTKTPFFDTNDFAFILDQIDAWLIEHEKTTDTKHKVELALAIYEAVHLLPASQKNAQIIQLLDFQTKLKAI
ncbi:MAG: hypothetical protein LBU87_04940 [Lactobacillales bacterium]|jgi:hypothetical protein|nr:hypothetical protein [Lactobacillales bacterium]